ncbi:MAG: HupE/UreJ family protein [Gammaproteobacteria bacterium]|nr:HupE/UreJ family protein [Gammaproteobacteria bacterium]
MFNKLYLKNILVFFAVFCTCSSAFAHGVQGGGLVNGLVHPVFGIDHLLAMIAIGILSVKNGGKAVFQVPLAFVVFMLIGGVLGMKDISFPPVELGIAASVIILGAMISLPKKLPVALVLLCSGIFGIFHGYAHGAEMPSVAEPLLYAAGFLISTAGLHVAGVLIGMVAKAIPGGEFIQRVVGVLILSVGIYIIFGL